MIKRIKDNPLSLSLLINIVISGVLLVLIFFIHSRHTFFSFLGGTVLNLVNNVIWKLFYEALSKKISWFKKSIFFALFSFKFILNLYIIFLLIVHFKLSAVPVLLAIMLLLISLISGFIFSTKEA